MPETEIHVLVVTDNAPVVEALRFGLPLGMSASFAHDARAAWSYLQTRSPSVVVVDLQSGSAGGFGLARDMAADARFSDIPVVILVDREQDAWLARQAGASFHRVKPIEGARLAEDLRALLESAKTTH